ncbi:ubiquitin carboxyl-terminal [Cyclospora cayetanensis]|uniref:Ubiquitin carboxyl-terminal n=1 Tax=Cyclospora cayetanensis TaxID=88456 RepID=A0A1D3CUF4_9EIME|nr:ubiquitin carboxyl-terminal [Cyclospora cayetanensis]
MTPPVSPVNPSDAQPPADERQQALQCTSQLSPSTPGSSSSQQQQQQQVHHPPPALPDYSLSALPPPSPWEVDFLLPSFLSRYAGSNSGGEPLLDEVPTVYSEWRDTPAVRFRLMVHPVSPTGAAAAGGRDRRFVGAFVETARREDYPEDWIFHQGCRFHIYAIHPTDYRKSIYKSDTYQFSCDDADRGWHQFASHQELVDESFLRASPQGGGGALYLRAGCIPICAAGGTPSVAARGMGRCGRGFVGLRNHGATCYMNALLQSLYFIGKFREAVYALSFDTKNTCGTRSVDILERRRCRRKRGRGFAASGVAQAKRGEAPSSAAASAASAGGASGNVSAVKGCNGAATAASSDEQMDVEGMSPSSVFSEGESSLAGGTAAAVLSEESTDSEDELSDLEESELRDLLVEEEAERRSPPSISLALQNLFLKLYTANEAVPYKELIRSFGWDAADAFTQQDTHELLKLLLDKVEEQMRGTPAEGSVKAMFEGEMETYVECINVEYKSVRKEAFEDVNLDVQGCSGVRESLQRLVMPELLEGDNAYDAEQHGKQTARKGVRFVRFPPICVFLLKRFDFDFARMDTVKVFDRYEFQRELDLNEFCEGAGVYALHSVSVHQGDVNSGHYYSFLRPPPGTQWVRFDDDKVYHVSEYAAIGDNFGGEELEACNYLRGLQEAPLHLFFAPSRPLMCAQVNPQILSRCRTEEQLRRLRTHIRNALEKSVRIKVYHPLQFKYRRFVELPYLSIPPIMDIKRSRNSDILLLHETITQELTRLLYGGGGRQGGPAGALGGAPNRVQFVLHLINTSMESPRFEAIELGTNMELGEILRRKGGGGGGGLEVSLYVLAVPEKSALFSTPLQHDEIVRSHCLLFIKYFPSLTRTARDVQLNKGGHLQQHHQQQPLPPPPQQQQQIVQANTDKGTQGELVICLDVVYRDLEPHVFRLIHEAMQEGLIDEGPSRAAEVARVVSAFPPTLPPLSSCAPYSAPLPVPLPSPQNKGDCYPPLQWSQGASVAVAAAQALGPLTAGVASSLQLTACLELDATDKIHTNRLLGRKTLRNSKVFSGDLLVFSLDLPPALLEYKEAQQKVGGTAADTTSSLVPWGGAPPREVRGLSLLPFVPRSRGGAIPPIPPPLPCYLCNDFVDYCLEEQATEIYHIRLYDPYEFLGKVMSSSGCLLPSPSLPPPVGEASSLLSEASLVSLPGSDVGAPSNEGAPCALQWIAWQFGVDPTQLQLFPEPPLLSDRKVLPLDIDALVVTNEGTWEQQQQLMLQRNEREGTGRRQLTLDEMLFISDSSNLLRIPPAEELSWLTLYAPSSQGRTRESITNLLAVPLRLEADYTPEEEDLIQSGALQVLLVQHQTPGDREPFGYPFEILVEPDATLSEIKAQIIRKLALPKNAWGSCTFFQLGDGVRCWKGPNDVLDWNKHRSITLIAEHSAPYTKHRGHGGMRIA